MNTFSVSRLALALAFGVTLTACSSTPPDQRPSDQTAPGTSSRPILSAKEAQNFDAQHYFASLTPGAAAWNPSPITLPAQPDFVVGPAGTQGVTHTTIQAAVDAAIIKRTNKRQYIAVMPGEYQGTVYVPAASVTDQLPCASAVALPASAPDCELTMTVAPAVVVPDTDSAATETPTV